MFSMGIKALLPKIPAGRKRCLKEITNVPVASPDGHKTNYLCLIKLCHRLPQLGHVAPLIGSL